MWVVDAKPRGSSSKTSLQEHNQATDASAKEEICWTTNSIHPTLEEKEKKHGKCSRAMIFPDWI